MSRTPLQDLIHLATLPHNGRIFNAIPPGYQEYCRAVHATAKGRAVKPAPLLPAVIRLGVQP